MGANTSTSATPLTLDTILNAKLNTPISHRIVGGGESNSRPRRSPTGGAVSARSDKHVEFDFTETTTPRTTTRDLPFSSSTRTLQEALSGGENLGSASFLTAIPALEGVETERGEEYEEEAANHVDHTLHAFRIAYTIPPPAGGWAHPTPPLSSASNRSPRSDRGERGSKVSSSRPGAASSPRALMFEHNHPATAAATVTAAAPLPPSTPPSPPTAFSQGSFQEILHGAGINPSVASTVICEPVSLAGPEVALKPLDVYVVLHIHRAIPVVNDVSNSPILPTASTTKTVSRRRSSLRGSASNTTTPYTLQSSSSVGKKGKTTASSPFIPPAWAGVMGEVCTPRGLATAFATDMGKPLNCFSDSLLNPRGRRTGQEVLVNLSPSPPPPQRETRANDESESTSCSNRQSTNEPEEEEDAGRRSTVLHAEEAGGIHPPSHKPSQVFIRGESREPSCAPHSLGEAHTEHYHYSIHLLAGTKSHPFQSAVAVLLCEHLERVVEAEESVRRALFIPSYPSDKPSTPRSPAPLSTPPPPAGRQRSSVPSPRTFPFTSHLTPRTTGGNSHSSMESLGRGARIGVLVAPAKTAKKKKQPLTPTSSKHSLTSTPRLSDSTSVDLAHALSSSTASALWRVLSLDVAQQSGNQPTSVLHTPSSTLASPYPRGSRSRVTTAATSTSKTSGSAVPSCIPPLASSRPSVTCAYRTVWSNQPARATGRIPGSMTTTPRLLSALQSPHLVGSVRTGGSQSGSAHSPYYGGNVSASEKATRGRRRRGGGGAAVPAVTSSPTPTLSGLEQLASTYSPSNITTGLPHISGGRQGGRGSLMQAPKGSQATASGVDSTHKRERGGEGGEHSAGTSVSRASEETRVPGMESRGRSESQQQDEKWVTANRAQRLKISAPAATEILPWLYVGGEEAARDQVQLLAKDQFHYLSLFLQDSPDEPIFPLIPLVIQFVERERRRKRSDGSGGKIFIHCHQGVSRSCSFVIAYCMWYYGWCYDRTYEYVRDRRTICSPNAGFFVNLQIWERQLHRGPMECSRGFAFAPFDPPHGVPRSFRRALEFFADESDREAKTQADDSGSVLSSALLQRVVVGHSNWQIDPRLPYGFLLFHRGTQRYSSYLLVPALESAAVGRPPAKKKLRRTEDGDEGSAELKEESDRLVRQWELFLAYSFYRQKPSSSRNDNNVQVQFDPIRLPGLWDGVDALPTVEGEWATVTRVLHDPQQLRSILREHLQVNSGNEEEEQGRMTFTTPDPRWRSVLQDETKVNELVTAYEEKARLAASDEAAAERERMREARRTSLPSTSRRGGWGNREASPPAISPGGGVGGFHLALDECEPGQHPSPATYTVTSTKGKTVRHSQRPVTTSATASYTLSRDHSAGTTATTPRDGKSLTARRPTASMPPGGARGGQLAPSRMSSQPPFRRSEEAVMRAGGERVEEMGPLFPLPAPALPIEDVQEEETGGPYTRGTDDNEMDIEHEFDEFDEPTEMTQDGDEEEDEETQLEAEELDVTVIAYPFTDPPLTDFFGDSLESSECYAIYLPGTDSKWFLWMGRSSEVSEEELVAAFRQYCAAELESHVEEEAGGERRHPGGRERRRAAESAEVVEEGNEPDVLLLALD